MSEYNIGSRLKKLRQARKLTLQAVANETGFSPALISQIENDNVSPPIATLSKIAKFFDIKLAQLFSEDEDDRKFEVVRAHERRIVPRVISKEGTKQGYFYESLSFYKQNKKMDAFMVTLTEKAPEANTYSHDGEEFIYVMKGNADFLLDDKKITLHEGDSLYFESSIGHRLLSHDGKEVKVLVVVTK
ncbi:MULTISPECIES: helix-turn-helix domain-containing protein [Geomonas]|uniref:Cupin domain-containing protein n=1 Tax=Geomonas subterranea TaxID=2847989 RepID=A0ABX8LJ06_9BACT|nr:MULTISPECIES: cupin domain-containing protein [Geomonas]MBU5613551.1 cupin domain-containing protein [Geomonas azotofigens]QXE91708.1 cupin domain-containing protein [Geomonas subterranea]QXM10199.1 cupin domain-containing protein [Geomonas subterranea]